MPGITYIKDPMGRVTLTAPSGGSSYIWSKSATGAGTYSFGGGAQTLTDNRPQRVWPYTTAGYWLNGIEGGTWVNSYDAFAGKSFAFATAETSITYNCVVTGGANAGTYTVVVDATIDRQSAAQALIHQIAISFQPPYSLYDWNGVQESLATFSSMYLMAAEEDKSKLLALAKEVQPYAAAPRGLDALYWAYRVFKTDDPTFAATCKAAYISLVNFRLSIDVPNNNTVADWGMLNDTSNLC
jgi:hypothetical protein